VGNLLRRRKRELKIALQQKIPPTALLQAFPAWACTSRTLCEILPATPALFDLVVVDEASQCDPALACVALLRAKRAVVVGDPQQLRHVCFLSHARQQAAFTRYGLPTELQERFRYRRSLFDIAADAVDQANLFFLNEHFRSHPQIIGFANHQFYDDGLHVMTSRPTVAPQTAIQLRPVPGRREERSSINRAEIADVVGLVKSLIQAESHGEVVPSVGVVSPFRDHADAIREALLDQLSADQFQRHAIVVGTAHALQGDEKDIVILSTSIDPVSHPASLRFLEDPHLLNVAITRARRQLIIVTSVAAGALPRGLLREFLTYAAQPWLPVLTADPGDGAWEREIVARLGERGLDVWPGFVAAGQRVNVVAGGPGGQVAVLCDGAVDQRAVATDALLAQRPLIRAGWRVQRVPERTWRSDWFSCCQRIADQAGAPATYPHA
jgi:superfamily I DNA and/or RNA helicase